MNGFAMMLKSMGIDPEQITATTQGLMSFAQSVDTRLTAIENSQQEIKSLLMAIANSAPTPEALPSDNVENEE